MSYPLRSLTLLALHHGVLFSIAPIITTCMATVEYLLSHLLTGLASVKVHHPHPIKAAKVFEGLNFHFKQYSNVTFEARACVKAF